MEHILDIDDQEELLFPIFKNIKESNAILLLGAGASVGEKTYLSKDLIRYYEEKIDTKLNESNITRWIDILSANNNFNRSNFDNFVNDLLKKLPVTESHKILASIPWREIITTNYDLLVERAFDEIENTSSKMHEIKIIRSRQEYNYRESNSEIKYIKLNGCIQDKSKYPLAFSTDDFSKLSSFYKVVLNDLRNLSPNISFISIGYSYSDDFGKDLLQKFDSYNYRDKKWLINVDPYPNEAALSYYSQQKIQIIKCSFEKFFIKYKKWEEENLDLLAKKKYLSVRNNKDSVITLPSKLLINLDGKVKQLNSFTKDLYIKEKEFYEGEEPNYNIITRDVDVIKSSNLEDFQRTILKHLQSENEILPIFFVLGDFGIGKSTFCFRLIHEMSRREDIEMLAFEILDINNLRKEDLLELINKTPCKNVLLYCDQVEISSHYQSLLDIRLNLSIAQIQDKNIFFIVSIRENILEKYKLQKNSLTNVVELKLNGHFNIEETKDLLEKLKKVNLVEYRDTYEQNRIIQKIEKEYNSDSFVSLMGIISSGKHIKDLIDSYHQLSKNAQSAFIYTALLHRYKILLPANWLKQIISMDWGEFTENIVKAEGKGILIQETKISYGTQPDLFFRTKHSLIAEKLINHFLSNKDKQYGLYERILGSVDPSTTTSYIVNDLLKTFKRFNVFSEVQINKLYDVTNNKMSDDPYFLLNYSINLQHRGGERFLKKALSILIYAESLLDRRNDKFIHRRAVLNYELADYYCHKKDYSRAEYYIQESLELFNTKQHLDPCSSFSYVSYIKAIIWKIKNLEMDEEERIQLQIKIEDLLKYANTTVTSGFEKINAVYSEYIEFLSASIEFSDYLIHIEELYLNLKLRPYASILLYNYYAKTNDQDKMYRYLEELELYTDNFEVVKFLFNIYGESLYNEENRTKLIQLSRSFETIENDMPFRYNYFCFIAESYNNNFHKGNKYIHQLRRSYNLNPSFHHLWKDEDGNVKKFEAKIILQKGVFKDVRVSSLQTNIRLIKGEYTKYEVGQIVNVSLHFYLYGLFAEIIEDHIE